MELKELKKVLFEEEEKIRELGERVSHEIFEHPELGDQEFYSSKFLTDEMRKLGFQVTMPYCGIPTAFRCELGEEDGPKVGFLAEYDALPGYGPDHDQNGHACGHNWIAGSTVAACAALARVKQYFKGRIVLIGTPAEETLGRKIDIAREGGFDDLDAAFQIHLGEYNSVDAVALACTELNFTFIGKATHASGSPELGINALDACNLTFAGVNAMRQHVTSDVRIHGIIKNGGMACNIVPDHCTMQYFVRSADKDYLEVVIERVLNCARGAALMTGAKLEWDRSPNTFYDYKHIDHLLESFRKNLEELGVSDFVQESIYHSGSTDVGNVSYCCPTAYGYLSTSPVSDAQTHDAAFLEVACSPYADSLIHTGAKAMAATALEIFCDETFRQKVKQEFDQKIRNKNGKQTGSSL